MSKVKSKQLTSGDEPIGKVLSGDGLGGVVFKYPQVEKGNIFPTSPTNGDLFYYTTDNFLYCYDNVRAKWLSVVREMITVGRTTIGQSITGYLKIGDTTFNSTTGILMVKNGTILSATVDNENALGANRNIEIRVNNSTTNRIILTILSGNKSASINNANLNFNENDLLQCLAAPNGTTPALNNVTVTFEIAWRN